MAITASNISVAQNPQDPNGTICTFIRSDTGQQVVIPVPVIWNGVASAEAATIKAAIQQWEAQANGLAAANSATTGIIV